VSAGTQLPDAAVSATGPHDELRVACRERGFTVDHCSDLALGYVIEATGSVELAADALAMSPRPRWVEEFCGP